MSYIKVLCCGIALLILSAFLLIFNVGQPSNAAALLRVLGGLLILPGAILTFDGIAKGRTLYVFSKKNGTKHTAFWHTDRK